MKKPLALILAVILVASFIGMLVGFLDSLYFFLIAGAIAIVAFKVIPRM